MTAVDRERLLREANGPVDAVVARLARFAPGEEQDLRNEAWSAVIGLLDAFDPAAGQPFAEVAEKAVVRECERYLRAFGRGGVSLDAIAASQERGASELVADRARGEPESDVPPAWWDDATAGLTARQRDVILLIYRDQSDPEAAAAKLGISVQAVNSIRWHALERLRADRPDLKLPGGGRCP